jgi:hypothetical protein
MSSSPPALNHHDDDNNTSQFQTPSVVAPSLEDDLDDLINSCFTNSPALNIKPLPVPPSLSDAPATPLSLGDDDEQFMAWLNEGSPTPSIMTMSPEQNKHVEANLDKIFDDSEMLHSTLFLLITVLINSVCSGRYEGHNDKTPSSS